MEPAVCSRCGGSGKLPQFAHIRNGVCFRCGGIGREGLNTAASLKVWLELARKEWVRLLAEYRRTGASQLADQLRSLKARGIANRQKYDKLSANPKSRRRPVK